MEFIVDCIVNVEQKSCGFKDLTVSQILARLVAGFVNVTFVLFSLFIDYYSTENCRTLGECENAIYCS